MKPIRLEVQAFGPYAGRQAFDFRELRDRGLFLIAGPTGAGKTTVLDAICYALYGDTSGQERDAAQMRSHHSDPATTTEVGFEFALGGETYRVWRRPQQERRKKRGEGMIADPAAAMLWKTTSAKEGKEGEPLATRASEVSDKVAGLLGFHSEQFRQVVLLPQGKFRELLKDDSRQRQEILETLFRTERYRAIEQVLKQNGKALEQELEGLREHRKYILEQAQANDEAELESRLTGISDELRQVAAELDRRRKAKIQADEDLQAGKDAQTRIEERDQAKAASGRLAARRQEMDAGRTRLEWGKRAAELRDAEAHRDLRVTEHERAGRAADEALRALAQAQAASDRAASALASEQHKQIQAERLRFEQARMESLVERVAKLAQAETELARSREAARVAAMALGEAKAKAARAEADLAARQKELAAAEVLAASQGGRQAAVAQAESDMDNHGKLARAEAAVKRLAANHAEAAKAARSIQEQVDAVRIEIRAKEAELQRGYAGHLARTLSAGQPCPVCGSLHHPTPATAIAGTPDPAELDALRERIDELDKARKGADKAEAESAKSLAVEQTRAESLRKQLGERASARAADLLKLCDAARKELRAAEQAHADCLRLRGAIEGLEKTHAAMVRQSERLQQTLMQEEGRAQSLAGTLTERQALVPPELRDPAVLQSAIAENEASIKRLAAALESAQTAAKKAAEALAGKRAAAQAAGRDAEERARLAGVEAEAFARRLAEAGFAGENEYKAAKLAGEQIAFMQQQLDQYDRELAAAQARLERADAAAKGAEPPDLASLLGRAQAAQSAADEALARQAQLTERRDKLGQLRESLAEDSRRTAELDQEYRTVGHVADVANGQNSLNVTFQRFVLGTLLDDVLAAASLRLRIMSKGRYQLRRQRDTLDRRRAGGLDLEVHDEYTGMSRPAGTLSGGESFLAALSLALGLADVVQSYAGGVYLDTMFIDEGFGSLDSEALDAAMQALVDLQKGGRLVGIISHVPELRERIDARLEITAGKSGSTAKFTLA